jgi:hypothetical protein
MSRRINRAMVLTLGDGAQSVAQQTAALSRTTVADCLPLAVVPLSPDSDPPARDVSEELTQRLTAACDALADAGLADRLRQQGLSIAFEDDLHVWLLADLNDEQVESESALTGLRLLEEIAWRRGRMTVIPHLLLLVEPEFQDRLEDWAGELARRCSNQVFLASAINLHHLRLSAACWQDNASAALTLLLWSHMPSHSSLAQSAASGASFCALGAALWPAPRALLRRWCEHWWIGLLIRRLQAGRLAETNNPTQSMVNDLKLHEAELSAATPPALAAESARNWRPAWGHLPTAGNDLLSRANRRNELRCQEHERARLAWLDARLSQWAESLRRRAADYLAPCQRWPLPALWRVELDDLCQRLQTECARVDAELDAAGQRLAAAESTLARETQALDRLCRSFPVNSLRGLLALMFQPWRWPFWAWRYSTTLPRQAQRTLDVLAMRNQRARTEANLHTLRQLGLAAAQDARLQSSQLDALYRLLAEMLSLIEPVLARTMAQTRSPWTAQRLERVSPAIDTELALALFEHWPLSKWGVDAAADALERAISHVGLSLAQMDAACASELLALAFAPTILVADEEAQSVGDWLTGFYRDAAPLWPVGEDQHAAYGECWFFAPEPMNNGAFDRLSHPGRDDMRAWAAGQPDLMTAEGATDAVAILRWTRVDHYSEP